MAHVQKMSEAQSLKRSHSKWSNFKLTLVCLLLALSVSVLVASAATIGTEVLPDAVATVAAIASGVLTVLSLFLISSFKR